MTLLIAAVLVAAPLPQVAVLEVDGFEMDNHGLRVGGDEKPDNEAETQALRTGVAAAGQYRVLTPGEMASRFGREDQRVFERGLPVDDRPNRDWRFLDSVCSHARRNALDVGRTLRVPWVIIGSWKGWPKGDFLVLHRINVRTGQYDATLTERDPHLSEAAVTRRFKALGEKLAAAPSQPEPIAGRAAPECKRFKLELKGASSRRPNSALGSEVCCTAFWLVSRLLSQARIRRGARDFKNADRECQDPRLPAHQS